MVDRFDAVERHLMFYQLVPTVAISHKSVNFDGLLPIICLMQKHNLRRNIRRHPRASSAQLINGVTIISAELHSAILVGCGMVKRHENKIRRDNDEWKHFSHHYGMGGPTTMESVCEKTKGKS